MIEDLCPKVKYHREVKILDTPNGKIVKELPNAGAKLGVSIEEWEHLKKGEPTYVKDDFFAQ